jgi:hypothetical protein
MISSATPCASTRRVLVRVLLLAVDEDHDVGVLFKAPDSRRSDSCGRWSDRDSGARLSCDSTTIGTFSLFGEPLSDREMDATSSVRFSKRPPALH